jgi:glutamine amidotransferase
MLVIVDYGVGNLMSIQNMLKKAGVTAKISGHLPEIADATKLLLPGMGAFDNCMERFNNSGLRLTIERKVFEEKIPVLGICVGLQMFMASSEEGVLPGLGWINGETIRFKQAQMNQAQKIPNMGWLEIKKKKYSRLLEGLDDARFYFAHSYHVSPVQPADILITADYGYEFVVGVEKDNIIGVQFHPEKSHKYGMALLKNFAARY